MNNFDLNSGNSRKSTLTSVAYDTVITHDISEEFSLPDYVPEVRKVLFTRAQILPESKYVSDNQGGVGVDFGGTVTYCVVYTDDEGNLCSTPLSSNYEQSYQLKSHPETVFIDTIPDSVTTRVNAPRKLTIKTRLKSRIFACENNEIIENISQKSSADELFIERLTENVKTVSVKSYNLQNVRMNDSFDTGSYKSIRPILCDAYICLKEVKPCNSSVSVRADAIVKCLCECDGEILTLSKSMPLYEEIEAEGALVSDMARAEARCVSLSISSEENNDTCELFFDMNCEIECEVYRNNENILTKDCYSTKYDIENTYKSIDLYTLRKACNSSFSLNEAIKRKNKDGTEIAEVLIDTVYEKSECKGERVSIFGKAILSIIAKGNTSGETEFIGESYEIPFKYDCDIGVKCENPIVRASFVVSYSNIKYSDDKLIVNAEIFPSIMILDKSSVQIMDSAVLRKDKEFKNNASCIRVFFPKDSDVLWEVAKKYHTTSKKIMEQNSLSSSSLKDIKSIII